MSVVSEPTPPVVPAPKPGWQTTEFWISCSSQVVGILALLGVIKPADVAGVSDAVTKTIGAVFVLIINAVIVIHYAQGRVSQKMGKSVSAFAILLTLLFCSLNPAYVRADPPVQKAVYKTGLFNQRRLNCQPVVPVAPAPQVVPVAPVVVMPPAAAIDPSSAVAAAALQSLAASHQQLVGMMAARGGCLGQQACPGTPAPVPQPIIVNPAPTPAPVLPPQLPLPPQQIIVVPQPNPPQQVLPIQGAPQQVLPIQGPPQQILPIVGAPQQNLPITGVPLQIMPILGAPQQVLPVGPSPGGSAPPQQLLPVVPQAPSAPQQLLPVGPGTAPPQQLLPIAPADMKYPPVVPGIDKQGLRPAPQPQRYAVYPVAQAMKYYVDPRTGQKYASVNGALYRVK